MKSVFVKKLVQIKNSVKFATALAKSKALGKRMPIMVSLHVTNRCNLRCPHCYANYDNRFGDPPPDFTTEEIERYIDDLYRLGMRWLTLLGGEPLLRRDIGRIIRHAKRKGILVDLVTNGYLLPEKLEEILPVDFICLSIEGDEAQHDWARNTPGAYRAILRALEALKDRGPKIRLHATLLRSNIEGIRHLSELAKRYDAEFGYSQVIVHEYNDSPEVRFSEEELRSFWRRLRENRATATSCYNSGFVLDYIADWPTEYRKLIRDSEDTKKYPGFDFLKCQYGERYCYIDSEGYMYRCIVGGVKSGPNIREVGVEVAWEQLAERSCEACSYIQHIEVNSLLNMKIKSIIKGIKYIIF